MPTQHKWSADVHTVSTYPEPDLFNQDAKTVATHLASAKVSPKGPASGMRMLNFYINRAGKNLSVDRRKELGHAKELLSAIIRERKESKPKASRKEKDEPAPPHKRSAHNKAA